MATQEEKTAILAEALAEYFEVEPETIRGFVFACERDAEVGVTLSSSWSTNTPFWHLLSYLDEARHLIERQNRVTVTEAAANGDTALPNRRRGTRRGQ